MTAFRAFRVDWRKKATVYRLLDTMPYGQDVYFRLQRHVTKTVPRELNPTRFTARWFLAHAKVLHQGNTGGLGSLKLFEFGAGWDLYGNCVQWCLGMNDQVVYDLTRWAKPDQINVVLEHLRRDPPEGAIRLPGTMLPTKGPFEPVLKQAYGIEYVAPADAGDTGRRAESFDACCTTSVFEHIPPAQISRLLKEMHRLLKPGAITSHVIDYSDHYAHSDGAITPYNYMAFTAPEWQRFSPGIHYQNRLRHSDYRALFEAAGFRVVSDHADSPEDAPTLLASVALSPEFSSRAIEELAPLVGHWVLERA